MKHVCRLILVVCALLILGCDGHMEVSDARVPPVETGACRDRLIHTSDTAACPHSEQRMEIGPYGSAGYRDVFCRCMFRERGDAGLAHETGGRK